MGVEGKLIGVDGGVITIYDGLCDIGFGRWRHNLQPLFKLAFRVTGIT